MAISCAKCGRQYDVTLFQFGRTINCVCGERVSFEHKMNLPEPYQTKFFADVMVARLVKWLRAIGIDTAWEDRISDKDLVKRAIEENRYVLTLDKKLIEEWRADNVLLLQSENPFEQFAEVVERFKIEKPEKLFTRCLVCNTILRELNASEITEELPQSVLENNKTFYFCRNCDKVFWKGSHTQRMSEEIERIFRKKSFEF